MGETLTALLEGPTDQERREGFDTELSPGNAAVFITGGTARVDLPSDQPMSETATAQLAHTLMQFSKVERVVLGGREHTRTSFETVTPQIVIESPLDGDAVSSPIRLQGTANVFEATVSIEVKDGTGTVVLEAFTTATAGTGTRGTFDTELVLPVASGTMTIVAFESSAKDGTPLHETDVQVTVEP